MIKVFISQPMKDKTPEEIRKERNEAIEEIKCQYGDCEIIDSYFADADIAVFCKGWKSARGCRIENTCAYAYGILVFDVEEEEKYDRTRL